MVMEIVCKIYDLSEKIGNFYQPIIDDFNLSEMPLKDSIIKIKKINQDEWYKVSRTIFFNLKNRFSTLPTFEQKLFKVDSYGDRVRESQLYLLQACIQYAPNQSIQHFFSENPRFKKYFVKSNVTRQPEEHFEIEITSVPLPDDCIVYNDDCYTVEKVIFENNQLNIKYSRCSSIKEFRDNIFG